MSSYRFHRFSTQREAICFFGHSWKYIERHYYVQRCYTSGSGFRGYFISQR